MGECKAGEKHREIFEIFHEIFHEIFQAKKFPEILHHYQLSTLCSPRRLLFLPPQICSERNYVTSKTETENRFLQKELGFGNHSPGSTLGPPNFAMGRRCQ